jgi:hypothetical protein
MAPRPTALLALWNDVDPTREAEYEDWHAREHVPERLTVPGMCWALRWVRCEGPQAGPDAPRYLPLYAMRDAAVVDSDAYHRLLAHPTLASRAMRPALRRVARWICTLDSDDGIGACDRIDGCP